MEDKKRKKDDKRKREASQKVTEQKNKVPDLTKPATAQSPASQSSSASPSPGPHPSASPSPATLGPGSAATPSQGGNNAKRLAVANGQPSTSSSSSTSGSPGAAGNGSAGSGGGNPAPQQPQRYMPREVPPRFRCQQDHKVLLKRGQPPLSSMLLGGGDNASSNMAAASDSGLAASSMTLTSSSVAASTTSSNYANSMWGASSGSQASSQGREKVIVDGNDEEEWPSIGGGDGGNGGGGMPVNSTSASGSRSSPTSSFSLPNECMHSSSGVAWGTTGGGSAVAAAGPLLQQASSLSKAPAVLGGHDASGPADGNSGIPGANFSPNANPSAWPALVQQDGPAAAGEGGLTSFHHQGSGGSANNSASLGLGGGAVGVLGAHPSISVNQSSAHQHQLHQMQSREVGGSKWDNEAAGPKSAGGERMGGADHGLGGGAMSVDEHSLASSWRGQPSSCPAANSKMGASRTEGWEGGGVGAPEGDKETSGVGYPSSTSGVTAWGGAGNGGNGSQTSGVSQGGWGVEGERGGSGSDWGGAAASVGVANAGHEEGGVCSSNSSSSGGSTGGHPPAAGSSSSTTTTKTTAWDNQKGEGETGEWGEGGQRTRGGSSSSGGNSRSGSGPSSNRPRRQALDAEAALQNLLSRSDLDPRILSNSGWGQTQIRQNTAWEVEGFAGSNRGGTSAAPLKQPSSVGGPSQYSSGPRTPSTDTMGPGGGTSMVPSSGSTGDGWESSSNSSSSGASLSGRTQQALCSNIRNLGVTQSGPVTSPVPGMGSGMMARPGQQAKPTEWGGADGDGGKGWGDEEWRSRREKGGRWGDVGQQGDGWGGNQQERGTGGWKEVAENGERGGWGAEPKAGSGKDWMEQESKSNSGGGGGWGDERRNGGHSGGDSGASGWGSWDDNAPRRNWGAGGSGVDPGGGMGSKPHMSLNKMPNSQPGGASGLQAQLQQQQSQPRNQQTLDQGAGGRKPFSQVQTHNQSSGWPSEPNPGGSEPSGWEEPSPQSISRKNDIDDGTAAWGDPTHCNYKPVNLWDKNSGSGGQQPHGQGPAQQQPVPAVQQQQQQPSRPAAAGIGDASGWGPSPASPTVDKGTAAWGKPTDTPSGWGDPDEGGGKTPCWGNHPSNPVRPGSKSMQDGWGDKESSMAASRHSSWEDEEDAGGMWNSTGSQGSSSSWGQGSNGGWGQSQQGKKPSNKGHVKSAGGDSWMSHINRQFSNMGLLSDDPSSPNMDLAPGSLQDKKMSDYNGDLRKGGRGGVIYRPPGAKEAAPGDAGSYYDKTLHLLSQDGGPGEEGPYSLYSPPTVFKPHSLFNHSIPFRQGAPGIFGSSGGMAQSRHQPTIPSINHSPGIRAQVPHQFLSPQVPGSVLKQMPPPSGSMGGVGGMGGVTGGGVFPPQLSPQHIAMLSSIYPPHIQLQLACQLLLQQQQQQQPPQQQQQQQLLQNQRKFTPNVRQQTDPQLARIMTVLQQQRQQQVGGLSGGSKLSPSHHGGLGPKLDPLPHPGLASSVSDLHQKNLGPYSGFGPGVNLPGLDLGGSMGGQQSRFKWMMEGNCSPDSSSPENAYHKNGPIAPHHMKMQASSPYSQYDGMVDGLADSWHRTPGNKMGSKPSSTPSWPPEFQPGVPWKGIDRVDPESDPYMTPGSMMGNAASPGLNDSEHQLLENSDSTPPLNTLLPSPGAWPYSASDSPLNHAHNPAKYADYKTSWPPEPIGHKSWKANRGSSQSQMSRPPPGLAGQKQPSSSPWSGGAPRLAGRGWGSGSGTTGSTWSDGSGRESCWLVLSNLTPQIDGSTLRTICMQHGPLLTFHLGLTQGTALIRYGSKQEASKAKSALHMCVLGNTTILAEFVSEEDVARYIAHSQAGGAGGGGTAAGSTAAAAAGASSGGGGGAVGSSVTGVEGAPSNPGGGGASSSSGWQSLESTGSSLDPPAGQGPGLGIFTQWSTNGTGGAGGAEPGRQGLWGGVGGMGGAAYPTSNLWASPGLEDRHQMGSPASLLPGDLLGGGADSI
ncbi:Trinucleotide repeat-containing gene 6B protein [Oryzias melastigma]|uniref:Trinucleotide repeat-containing gene 6B protein n=1 Tax=Oryzias melastigma TaxID=30732 RepID=A0A834CXM8_ORYME|nr:Trinucleotide repeat-containing gene 6B protein [Oryzias melastigma]